MQKFCILIEKMLENRVPSSEEDTSIHYLKEEFLTAIPGCMLPPLSVKEIVLANLFPDNKKSEGMIKFQNDSSIEITTPIEKWAIAVDHELKKSFFPAKLPATSTVRTVLEIDVTLLQGSVAIHLKNQSGATIVQQNVGELLGFKNGTKGLF